MIKILIFTEYVDGKKLENVIEKKGKGFVEKTYIDGEFWDERKIYKVGTEKPYVRAYCTKFYFTGEMLEAFKEYIKEVG